MIFFFVTAEAQRDLKEIDQGLVTERDIVVVLLVVQVVLVIRVEHLKVFNHHLG